MLNCKQATRLLSDARERDLRLGERVPLKLHLAICVGCTNFRKQMDFLQRACRGYLKRQGFGDDA